MNKRHLFLIGLLCVSVSLSLAVGAWAASVDQQANPTPAEAAQIAAGGLRVKVAGAVEATAAATAAEDAAKAAVKAEKDAATAEAAAKDPASTLESLKAKSNEASEAAKAAVGKSAAAAKAAAAAAAKVVGDLAKLRAVRASEAAQKGSADTETAATAAAKAHAKVQAATTADAARNDIAAVVAETHKAATATTAAAEQTTVAATQLAAPDLPVTGESDEDVFAALRVNLSGGAVFFNGDHEIIRTTGTDGVVTGTIKSSQFSQATMYLAVEAQPRLLAYSPGCPGPVSEAARKLGASQKLTGRDLERAVDLACATASRRIIDDRGYNRLYIEPFINVRLTAIPVATGKGDLIQAPDATFVKTEKAVQTQFGGLFSWNFGGFKVRESHFHWAIAPVFRATFQSVTDSNRATRVWNLDDDLYHAITAGGRLLLYQKNRLVGDNVREGWSPVAYVDFSWGQFQNFETAEAKDDDEAAKKCLEAPAVCLAGKLPPEEAFKVDSSKKRLSIEARLMLQFVYLGLDINNGDGGDDLRFIAGLTVKLDRFMRRQ